MTSSCILVETPNAKPRTIVSSRSHTLNPQAYMAHNHIQICTFDGIHFFILMSKTFFDVLNNRQFRCLQLCFISCKTFHWFVKYPFFSSNFDQDIFGNIFIVINYFNYLIKITALRACSYGLQQTFTNLLLFERKA